MNISIEKMQRTLMLYPVMCLFVGRYLKAITLFGSFDKLNLIFMVTGSQIFYADAQHHVFVTDSMFIIKDKEYNLPSIRDHIIKEIKPAPTAGFVVAISGTVLVLGGVFHLIALRFMPNVTLMSFTFGPFSWSVFMGVIFLFGGLFMIATAKPKYALHISTPEGENDVLVSPKREYIRQIIDALNRAFMLRVK